MATRESASVILAKNSKALIGERKELNQLAATLASTGNHATQFAARAFAAIGTALGVIETVKKLQLVDKSQNKESGVNFDAIEILKNVGAKSYTDLVAEQAAVKVSWMTKKPKGFVGDFKPQLARNPEIFGTKELMEILDAITSSFTRMKEVYSASHKRKVDPNRQTDVTKVALTMPFRSNALQSYIASEPFVPQGHRLFNVWENLRQQMVNSGRYSNSTFTQVVHRRVAAGQLNKAKDGNGDYFIIPSQAFNAAFAPFYGAAEALLRENADLAARKGKPIAVPPTVQFSEQAVYIKRLYYLFMASTTGLNGQPTVDADGKRKYTLATAFPGLSVDQARAEIERVEALRVQFTNLNDDLTKNKGL